MIKNIPMKKLIYNIIFLICLTICVGCKKALDEHPKSFVNPAEFYNTAEEAQSGVNGIYAVLYDFFSPTSFFILTESASDLMYTTAGTDFNGQFSYSPAAPGVGTLVWSSGYKGILYANNTIYGIENSPLSDEAKKPLIAEAKFLRSLFYFFLTNTFDDVPYWDFALNTENKVDEVSVLPRTNASEIRKKLIADLKLFSKDLPLIATGVNTGRITKGAALALLTKIALFEKDWQSAIDAGEEIIKDNNYKLLNSYADVFKSKNNEESIFEIQFSYSATGVKRSHTLSSNCMPAPRVGTTMVYDGVDIGTNSVTTYGNTLPTRVMIGLFTDPKDTRKDVALAYSFKGKTFNRFTKTGLPWLGVKFWDFTAENLASDRNLTYLRYADVLLMLSEAYNEKSNPDQALKYLNLIKKRALVDEFTNTDQTAIRLELRNERGRELAGEFHRRWDLVRWGVFFEEVKKTNLDNPSGVKNLKPYHGFYPIPDMERIKNTNLSQNDGYF